MVSIWLLAKVVPIPPRAFIWARVPVASKFNWPRNSLAIWAVVLFDNKPVRIVFCKSSVWDAAILRKAVLTFTPLGKLITAPSRAVKLNFGIVPVWTANSSGNVNTFICRGSVLTTLCANCGLISTVRTAFLVAWLGNTFFNCSCIKSDCNSAKPCNSWVITNELLSAQVV